MEYLPLLSALSMLIYVPYIIIRYGWLPSISHSIYEHNKPFLFFAFMSSVGLPILFYGYLLPETVGILLVLSGLLFFTCGLSPYFHSKTESGEDNKFESIMHSIGAEGGILAALLYLGIVEDKWQWLVLMSIFVLFTVRNKFKNHTLWLEVFGALFITFGIYTNWNLF